jgi:putative hydrolase of the HAD superfamily
VVLVSLPPRDAIDALVLDLDDTILDDRAGSGPAWEAAVALLCDADPALEGEVLLAAIRAEADWFWSDPERHRRGRLDLFAARLEVLERALAGLGRRDGERARAALHRYEARRAESFRLAQGAAEALERLRAAFPRLALLTNGASAPQRGKIERFQLAGFFDHIQVEGEVGVGKPEPEAFQRVAVALSLEPARCLMVGDDYGRDVVGALGAGMQAAWIDALGRGAPPEPPARPVARVRSLAELAARLAG